MMQTPITHVLLIMNCEKYIFKANYQKETWLSNLPIPYFHVRGDKQLGKDYVVSLKNRTITVKTGDDYNSLPKKVIAAYQAALEIYPELKYVFKTDDDQVLHVKSPGAFFSSLITMLEKDATTDSQIHYGGHIVNVRDPHYSMYYKIHPGLPTDLIVHRTRYCSGRFYFLSADALRFLLEKRHCIEEEYLEDYAVGFHLDDKYKTDMKHIMTPILFKDMPGNVVA